MSQVDFSKKVTRNHAEKIIELVEKLEQVDNLQKIVELAAREQ
jgi:hypothetical protein